MYPTLPSADSAFATIVKDELPIGVRGLVLAAALAAVMSTSSGALIACATVANNDIWSRLRGVVSRGGGAAEGEHDEVKGNRVFILVMGVAVILIAIALNDVVEALTVAYNLLVGGLLVPILGGLLWRRGTAAGALAAVSVGGLAVIGLMAAYGILANEPVYYGLAGLARGVRDRLPGDEADRRCRTRGLARTPGGTGRGHGGAGERSRPRRSRPRTPREGRPRPARPAPHTGQRTQPEGRHHT